MKKMIVCVIVLAALFHGRLSAEEHNLTEWTINEIISGPEVKLEDLSGKVVMIEFWGRHCPPCLASLPELAKLDRRYSKKGLCIIGVHAQDGTKEEILEVAKDKRVKFTIAQSGKSPIKFNSIPKLFVFDSDGKMVLDGRPGKEAEKLVKKLLRTVKLK